MKELIRRVWWLDPAWLFVAVIGGTMMAAALQNEESYLKYGTPKYIQTEHVLLAAGAILAFVAGCKLNADSEPARQPFPRDHFQVVWMWFKILATLTVLGYAIWGAQGVRSGFSLGMLREMLSDPDGTPEEVIRNELFPTIPGVTTCAQFGVSAMLLGSWLLVQGERRVIWPMALIAALATLRALLWSERLAILELAIPGVVLWLRAQVLGRMFGPGVRGFLQLAPAIGVVCLAIFFGAAEYFRSWPYYQDEFESVADFTLWRLSGYYTTAHNNSVMAVETVGPLPFPYWTMRSLWTLPGQQNSFLAYDRLTGIDPIERHVEMLKQYGTPELNNEGGLFMPLVDWGVFGFLIYWFLFGLVAGTLYRSFLAGRLAGILMYPVLFLAILETPRFLYLSYTRAFPTIVISLVVLWHAKRSSQTVSAEPYTATAIPPGLTP